MVPVPVVDLPLLKSPRAATPSPPGSRAATRRRSAAHAPPSPALPGCWAAVTPASEPGSSTSHHRRAGLGQQVQGVAGGGEHGRAERWQQRGSRCHPGHDLLVVQARRGRPGGLVDAVPGLGCTVLRAAQRRSQHPEPGASSSSAGVGEAVSSSHRATSRRDRPEAAAARNSAHNSSCAAGPHRSRCRPSATVSTKWTASRWADSTLASPRSGSHHHCCGWQAIRRGSKSQAVPPRPARSAAVAAHRSGTASHAIESRDGGRADRPHLGSSRSRRQQLGEPRRSAGLRAHWLRDHVADCDRCRGRL